MLKSNTPDSISQFDHVVFGLILVFPQLMPRILQEILSVLQLSLPPSTAGGGPIRGGGYLPSIGTCWHPCMDSFFQFCRRTLVTVEKYEIPDVKPVTRHFFFAFKENRCFNENCDFSILVNSIMFGAWGTLKWFGLLVL